jgi:hypothetical protein
MFSTSIVLLVQGALECTPSTGVEVANQPNGIALDV